jgi:hypothetical protein
MREAIPPLPQYGCDAKLKNTMTTLTLLGAYSKMCWEQMNLIRTGPVSSPICTKLKWDFIDFFQKRLTIQETVLRLFETFFDIIKIDRYRRKALSGSALCYQ